MSEDVNPKGQPMDTEIAMRISSPGAGHADSSTDEARLAGEVLRSGRALGANLRQDVALVHALVKYDVSSAIPHELPRAMAEILAFVQRLELSGA